jgi:hypothetical protein
MTDDFLRATTWLTNKEVLAGMSDVLARVLELSGRSGDVGS